VIALSRAELSMRPLRLMLERCSRHWVFRRRLPARFGGRRLWVTPAAALAYFRSLNSHTWDDLYDFAQQFVRQGDSVWDVGANLGVLSFAAAHQAGATGEVLAIEADGWLVELMRRSADEFLSAAAPVEVLCCAIAAENGLQLFARPERARSGSHLTSTTGAGDALLGPTVSTHPVITTTLDWLGTHRRKPDVIKIDVEGAELAVLRGAHHILLHHRPRLLLEVYESNADEITELLHSLGYDLYNFSAERAGRRPVQRAVYNTLALPRPI